MGGWVGEREESAKCDRNNKTKTHSPRKNAFDPSPTTNMTRPRALAAVALAALAATVASTAIVSPVEGGGGHAAAATAVAPAPPSPRPRLRVLAIPLVSGRSHLFFMHAIAAELAGRGHDVKVCVCGGERGWGEAGPPAPARAPRRSTSLFSIQTPTPPPTSRCWSWRTMWPPFPPPSPGGASPSIHAYGSLRAFDWWRDYLAASPSASPLQGGYVGAWVAASDALLSDTTLMQALREWGPHVVVGDIAFLAAHGLASTFNTPLATISCTGIVDPLHADLLGFSNDAGVVPQFGTGLAAPMVCWWRWGWGCFFRLCVSGRHNTHTPSLPPSHHHSDLLPAPAQPCSQVGRPVPLQGHLPGALGRSGNKTRHPAAGVARLCSARDCAPVQRGMGGRVVSGFVCVGWRERKGVRGRSPLQPSPPTPLLSLSQAALPAVQGAHDWRHPAIQHDGHAAG